MTAITPGVKAQKPDLISESRVKPSDSHFLASAKQMIHDLRKQNGKLRLEASKAKEKLEETNHVLVTID
jgi:hypothetical protein